MSEPLTLFPKQTRCGYCGRELVRQASQEGWSCLRCVPLLAEVRTGEEWAKFTREARTDG